mmetsp:Transcript_62338/g.115708  ORF Transcript_62338/g.115708 Transcript_62338/m.115708 type:complete len:104 (+) Transcript_62338:105-416(+)
MIWRCLRAPLLSIALAAAAMLLNGCGCKEEEFQRCLELRTDLDKISSSQCVATQALVDCVYDYGCCDSESQKSRMNDERLRLEEAGVLGCPVWHDLCTTCMDC